MGKRHLTFEMEVTVTLKTHISISAHDRRMARKKAHALCMRKLKDRKHWDMKVIHQYDSGIIRRPK